MRILLVSYFYRPSILSGSRRLGMIVDALRSQGHEVYVIAGGTFVDFNEPCVLRPKYRDLWWTLHARAKKHGVISWYKRNIKQSKLNSSIRPMWWTSFSEVMFPDKYVSWIRPATRLGCSIIRERKIDLIYSSFPAPSSIVTARRIKERMDLPWVCELRDLWVDSPHDVPYGTFAMFNRWYERRVLSGVNAFIGVTEGITKTIEKKYGKPSYTVYSPVEYYGCHQRATEKIFSIIYTGALYSGSRDISALIRAIKILESRGEVSPEAIQFKYFGYDDKSSVDAMFEKYDAINYLSYGGWITRERSIEEQSKAALLYVVPMSSDARFDGIMTAKVFEYLGHQKPILATSVQDGELDRFLRMSGCGLSLVEPVDIADSLSRWIKHYKKGDPYLGEFNPRKEVLQRYTKEELAKKLTRIFKIACEENQKRVSQYNKLTSDIRF